MPDSKMTPQDLAAMYEARRKTNAERVPNLFDTARLRVQVQEFSQDPYRCNVEKMKKKYAYLCKASPHMFEMLSATELSHVDRLFKLLDDIDRVARNELSNEQVGENIVNECMAKKAEK